MKQHKAQIGIAGFLMAMAIFSGLLIILISTWNLYLTRFETTAALKEMQLKASQVTDILIQTQGYPPDWEDSPSTMLLIGLAASDHNLSRQKLEALPNISYTSFKNSLTLFSYDLFLDIAYIDGTSILTYGKPFNGTLSVQSSRIVTYDGKTASLRGLLWH